MGLNCFQLGELNEGSSVRTETASLSLDREVPELLLHAKADSAPLSFVRKEIWVSFFLKSALLLLLKSTLLFLNNPLVPTLLLSEFSLLDPCLSELVLLKLCLS